MGTSLRPRKSRPRRRHHRLRKFKKQRNRPKPVRKRRRCLVLKNAKVTTRAALAVTWLNPWITPHPCPRKLRAPKKPPMAKDLRLRLRPKSIHRSRCLGRTCSRYGHVLQSWPKIALAPAILAPL